MAQTLFGKYGGFGSVSRIVLTFYDMALDSDQIGGFFENVDMRRLVDHQTKFVSSLMGGPASYSDAQLRQLHARLEISNADFDEMGRLLGEALAQHGIEPEDCESVMREIEARRDVIVTRDAA